MRRFFWIGGVLWLCAISGIWAQIPEGTDNPNEGPVRNLQVMKATDRKDVLDQMFFQTRSLGVKCTHCHDPNNYASDTLQAKKTAREMMKMVADINGKYLASQKEPIKVTCFTCHRGAVEPLNDPSQAKKEKKK